MEKTILIVNSQTSDNRLCALIARTIFNATVLYVNDENSLTNYSNQSIFDSGLIDNIYLIDVLPNTTWIETNLETYPNLKVFILSKNVDNNTYFNLANVVKVIERNSCATLSFPLFYHFKMEYWIPDGETMQTVLYKMEALLMNYEKYCKTFNTDSIRIANHYNYLLVNVLTDKYWSLNLSHEHLILQFKTLNVGVNNLSGTLLSLFEQEALNLISKTSPEMVEITPETTILVNKFNLDLKDYKNVDLKLRNILANNENTFHLFYEIDDSSKKVICQMHPSLKLLSPIPLYGQDIIEYLSIESIAKINLFVQQKYNVQTEMTIYGTIKFELTFTQFFLQQ